MLNPPQTHWPSYYGVQKSPFHCKARLSLSYTLPMRPSSTAQRQESFTRRPLSRQLGYGPWWLSSGYHSSLMELGNRKLFISLWWRFSSQEVRLASDLCLPSQLSLVLLHMLAWHFLLANLIPKTFVSFTLKWKVNLWLELSLALLWLQMPRLSLLCSLGSPSGSQGLRSASAKPWTLASPRFLWQYIQFLFKN